jgi:hypothetical protein
MKGNGLVFGVCLFLAVLAVGGCGLIGERNPALRTLRNRNREKIATHLEIEMTEEAVRKMLWGRVECSEIFGPHILCTNPYRSETVEVDGETYLVLWYYTEVKHYDGVIACNELTPIVLEGGDVVGWGRRYMDELVAAQAEPAEAPRR